MFKLVSQALYANGKSEARFILRWFAISLLLHFIIAFFSIGFYHYDEHFQILEFGGFKAGNIPASTLPWEYAAQIRPAFQPFIVYLFIRVLGWFHVQDPFLVAALLRFVSALLGWASIFLVTIAALRWFPLAWLRRAFIVFSSVLGGLIFIHVRFSSESWSGSFAFIALALLLLFIYRGESLKTIKQYPVFLLAGLFLGLSYICRFQSLFLFPGIFLWLLFIRKTPISKLLIICGGIGISVFVGFLIDRWFYGRWVNTVYNYYIANIVEGKAALYGVAPWWWYFPELMKYGIYAMQGLMLVCVLIAIFRNPRNLIIWACVPFLLAHIMVSHKELRFLFPIADALPVLVALGVQGIHLENVKASVHKFICYLVLSVGAIFIFLNAGILFNLCKYPPQSFIDAMHYVYMNHKEPVDIIVKDNYLKTLVDGDPLKMSFYKRPNARFINIVNPDSVKIIIGHDTNTVLLMVANKGYALDTQFASSKPYLAPEYYQMPVWMKHFNFNHWVDRTGFWQVDRAVKPNR